MRNVNEKNVTEIALKRYANCDTPRRKQILASLIRHLHDFGVALVRSEDVGEPASVVGERRRGGVGIEYLGIVGVGPPRCGAGARERCAEPRRGMRAPAYGGLCFVLRRRAARASR